MGTWFVHDRVCRGQHVRMSTPQRWNEEPNSETLGLALASVEETFKPEPPKAPVVASTPLATPPPPELPFLNAPTSAGEVWGETWSEAWAEGCSDACPYALPPAWGSVTAFDDKTGLAVCTRLMDLGQDSFAQGDRGGMPDAAQMMEQMEQMMPPAARRLMMQDPKLKELMQQKGLSMRLNGHPRLSDGPFAAARGVVDAARRCAMRLRGV